MKTKLTLLLIGILVLTFFAGNVNAENSLTIDAFDEITRQEVPYQINFFLQGTNTTVLNIVGERLGKPCFYDNDESTSCLSITATEAGSSKTDTAQTTTVQGFGQNLVYFKLVWDSSHSGSLSAQASVISIYQQNGTLIYTDTKAADGTYTDYVKLDNRYGYYSNVENLTLNITAAISGSVGASVTTKINEFRLYNTSAGYIYAGNTNNTVTIPAENISNFATYDAWVRGEQNHVLGYSNQRMYRISFSPLSNYSLYAYLLNDSAGYLQYFNILDANNQPINNALMEFQRPYSDGISRTVVQCASNPAGSCSTFIAPYVAMSMFISATGYTSKNSTNVVFTGSPNPANVYLTSSASGNFTSIFTGLSASLSPTDQYFNSAINTSCVLTASLGNINSINLSITQNINGTETFYNSTNTSSAPTGATLTLPINNNGRFTISCVYDWVSNATGSTQTYENTKSITVWIYSDTLANAGQGSAGFGDDVNWLIVAGFLLLIATPIAIWYGATYGVLTGIIIMSIAAWVGFLSWYTFGLAALIAIALVVLKSWL